jgi:hypothetical protein
VIKEIAWELKAHYSPATWFTKSFLALSHCPLPVYCVEKVERQRFREASDIQPLRDRSITAVLVSLGR